MYPILLIQMKKDNCKLTMLENLINGNKKRAKNEIKTFPQKGVDAYETK